MLLPFVAAIAETSGETAGHEGKGKIVVLATGGTIAGIGEEGKTAGYIPGVLTAEELLLAVPDLEKVAQIEAIQICNVNSDDITAEHWIALARAIDEMSAKPDITNDESTDCSVASQLPQSLMCIRISPRFAWLLCSYTSGSLMSARKPEHARVSGGH